MIKPQLPVVNVKKAYSSPNERVTQARLRLIAAIKMRDQGASLIPSKKRSIGIPAIAFSFAAGFIIGFSPSLSKTVSREGASLLQRWLTNRMSQ
ncbi:MAG: hypothetical protein ACU4EQ_01035 [Candidatus Nitrosoglobus sp.]|jgi:hypothetical protein